VRLPALDGLRGLAILAVVAFHCSCLLMMREPTWLDRLVSRVLHAGWCGVDLFFTLSGYLITGLLLDLKEAAAPLGPFYARRLLRIAPLYYLVLALHFWVVPLVVPARFASPELDHQAWYWLYLSNVHFSLDGTLDPLVVHTWSLAVEEQFYLLWPLVVLRCDRPTLISFATWMIPTALALRLICWGLGGSVAAYMLTPCHMDSLAAGALIVAYQRTGVSRETLLRWAWGLGAAAAVGIAFIVAERGIFWNEDSLGYTLGITVATAGAAALVLAARFSGAETRLHRVLASRALQTVGRVSYGMYLFHLPLLGYLVLAQLDLRRVPRAPGASLTPWFLLESALVLAVTFILAFVSWHLFEKRLLAWRRPAPALPTAG
jgi:peptidoglycan/LPS O-acetylase OafA/YrhL